MFQKSVTNATPCILYGKLLVRGYTYGKWPLIMKSIYAYSGRHDFAYDKWLDGKIFLSQNLRLGSGY